MRKGVKKGTCMRGTPRRETSFIATYMKLLAWDIARVKFLKTAKSTVCTGRLGCKLTCNRCSEVRPLICIHLTKQQRQVACIPLPTACGFCTIRWWCKQIMRSGTVQTCWNELLCCWWQRIWIPQRLKFCIFVMFYRFCRFHLWPVWKICTASCHLQSKQNTRWSNNYQPLLKIRDKNWRTDVAPFNSLCYYVIQWFFKTGFDETIKDQLIQIKIINNIHRFWNIPKPYNNIYNTYRFNNLLL